MEGKVKRWNYLAITLTVLSWRTHPHQPIQTRAFEKVKDAAVFAKSVEGQVFRCTRSYAQKPSVIAPCLDGQAVSKTERP
jgi:hypothetical protein